MFRLSNIQLDLKKKSYDYTVELQCSEKTLQPPPDSSPVIAVPANTEKRVSFSEAEADKVSAGLALGSSVSCVLNLKKTSSGEVKTYNKSTDVIYTTPKLLYVVFGEVGSVSFCVEPCPSNDNDDKNNNKTAETATAAPAAAAAASSSTSNITDKNNKNNKQEDHDDEVDSEEDLKEGKVMISRDGPRGLSVRARVARDGKSVTLVFSSSSSAAGDDKATELQRRLVYRKPEVEFEHQEWAQRNEPKKEKLINRIWSLDWFDSSCAANNNNNNDHSTSFCSLVVAVAYGAEQTCAFFVATTKSSTAQIWTVWKNRLVNTNIGSLKRQDLIQFSPIEWHRGFIILLVEQEPSPFSTAKREFKVGPEQYSVIYAYQHYLSDIDDGGRARKIPERAFSKVFTDDGCGEPLHHVIQPREPGDFEDTDDDDDDDDQNDETYKPQHEAERRLRLVLDEVLLPRTAQDDADSLSEKLRSIDARNFEFQLTAHLLPLPTRDKKQQGQQREKTWTWRGQIPGFSSDTCQLFAQRTSNCWYSKAALWRIAHPPEFGTAQECPLRAQSTAVVAISYDEDNLAHYNVLAIVLPETYDENCPAKFLWSPKIDQKMGQEVQLLWYIFRGVRLMELDRRYRKIKIVHQFDLPGDSDKQKKGDDVVELLKVTEVDVGTTLQAEEDAIPDSVKEARQERSEARRLRREARANECRIIVDDHDRGYQDLQYHFTTELEGLAKKMAAAATDIARHEKRRSAARKKLEDEEEAARNPIMWEAMRMLQEEKTGLVPRARRGATLLSATVPFQRDEEKKRRELAEQCASEIKSAVEKSSQQATALQQKWATTSLKDKLATLVDFYNLQEQNGADKFSTGRGGGLFSKSNWKHRYFSLVVSFPESGPAGQGVNLLYAETDGGPPKGTIALTKDTQVISAPTAADHPEAKGKATELVVTFKSDDGAAAAAAPLKLLMRFSSTGAQRLWRDALKHVVGILAANQQQQQ